MKRYLLATGLVALFGVILSLSCKKEVSRGIDIMNDYHSTIDTNAVKAPCDSLLTNNTACAAISTSFSGSVSGTDELDYMEVLLTSYSTYEQLIIYLPSGGWPIMNKVYTLVNVDPSSLTGNQAEVVYVYGSYSSSIDYNSTSGSLYVDVTSSSMVFSFCSIPVVSTGYSPTTVQGKITCSKSK
ncbi:MAG: hypothetical protein ABR968_13540 [Bacteroidales bacterium]|jgi:hypothetical protein